MRSTISSRSARTILCSVLLLVASNAQAATRIIVKTMDKGSSGQAQIVVSKNRIRVTHSQAPRQEMLFNVADQLVLFINHPRKEITRVDSDALKQSMGQLAGIADQLQAQRENLPEEKREQLDAMLESLGIMNPDAIGSGTLKIKALGRTHEVGGFACSWWQVSRDDTLLSRSCLSNNGDLQIEPNDYRALLALSAYVQDLQLSASALMSSLGFSLPPLGLPDDASVPIRIENVAGDYTAEVAAIDHLDAGLQLSIPGGYRILEFGDY